MITNLQKLINDGRKQWNFITPSISSFRNQVEALENIETNRKLVIEIINHMNITSDDKIAKLKQIFPL